MASRLTADFSKWPMVSQWHIDNAVEYGMYRWDPNGKFYASRETLDDYREWQNSNTFKDYISTVDPAWASGEHSKSEATAPKIREEVLDTAKGLVVGDRNAQYGEPYDDFLKVAEALNAYGFRGPGGRNMLPRDVPFFQILVKLSRIVQSPLKLDSWTDTAGYAACGAEVAHKEAELDD